jgi:hypothetical protein
MMPQGTAVPRSGRTAASPPKTVREVPVNISRTNVLLRAAIRCDTATQASQHRQKNRIAPQEGFIQSCPDWLGADWFLSLHLE